MGKFERWGAVFTWAVILLALAWLALVAVPQFVDRISRHEDRWAREFTDLPSAKPSNGD